MSALLAAQDLMGYCKKIAHAKTLAVHGTEAIDRRARAGREKRPWLLAFLRLAL
jgi:hypothetical protein